MLALNGFAVGITGHRRSTEQADMLAKRGATVMVGPMIQSVPLDDIDATIVATRAIIADPVDVFVLTTGVGTRSWLGVAELASIDDDLRAASRSALVLARGPKARSAAIGAGLDVSWQAPGETGDEIVAYLDAMGVAGKRVAVQRDGGVDLPRSLAVMIGDLGAEVIEVPVYRWKLPDDLQPALRLVAAVVGGRIDVLTFTSAIAVDNMFEIAADEDALLAALNGPCVAVAVGPVTAQALRRHGVGRVVEPERARLGSMVQAVVSTLSGRSRTLAFDGMTASWQGLAVMLGDGSLTTLTVGEARLLDELTRRAPAVVPKQELVDAGSDGHAAESAVARLRVKLGPLGQAISAVPRRGYRCELVIGPAD
jgi:uroporphyrinogen-III synthase